MSFCENGTKQAKKFLKEIDDKLHSLMQSFTTITGKIKAIEGNPTVEQIVAIVPGGSVYEAYLNDAIDLIAKGLNTADSLAHKIVAWLDDETEDGKDMKLVKLSQVATKLADGKHEQSFYDTAVQADIYGLKPVNN